MSGHRRGIPYGYAVQADGDEQDVGVACLISHIHQNFAIMVL